MKQDAKDGLVIARNKYCGRWKFWIMVYEWEDEILRAIPNAKLYVRKEDPRIAGRSLFRFLNNKCRIDVDRPWMGKNQVFYYELAPIIKGNRGRNNPRNSVCIIDYYERDNLAGFYKSYSNVAHLFVSSREVYDFLQEHNPPRKVEHLPLTLASKWLPPPTRHAL